MYSTRRTILAALAAVGGTALGKPAFAATTESVEGWPYAKRDPANTNHAPDVTGPQENIAMESIISVSDTPSDGIIVADGTVSVGSAESVAAYSLGDWTEQWRWSARDPPAGEPIAYANQLLFVLAEGEGQVARFIETDTVEQRLQARVGRDATITPVGEDVYVSGAKGLVSLDRSGTGQWQQSFEQASVGTAVQDGTVFVTTQNEVVALSRAEGEVQWRESVSALEAPVVANGRVYVAGETLAAFDSTDGTQLWRSVELPSATTAPAATAETVYVGAGEDGTEHTFFALDAETGELEWQAKLGSTAVPTASPATTRPAVTAETVYVGGNRTMHGIDTESGEILWRESVDGAVGSPVPVGGQLLFTTDAGKVLTITETESGEKTDQQSSGQSSEDGQANQTDDDTETGDDGDVDEEDAEDSDDGSGPGFGLSTGLTALGGVGYLLRRRLRSGREEPSRKLREEMDQREE
ncbi:PQQ-binding-like beta-propeller repeat protein [Halovenus sp. HT40]|uniref:PQQ-binding-like beta-propeller repeat protein n=1 Tax=Halovenus sp. HT40 TaxID=3126691 RepID=UPI00300F6DA2